MTLNSRSKRLELYRSISSDYNIPIITAVQKGDTECKANGEDSYINRSYNTHDQIWIGIYEDKEFELISFFHEVGHCAQTNENVNGFTYYEIEKDAWKRGYEIAEKYGITFSEDAKKWAETQLETYNKPEYGRI
jgi:hypothetical protein